MPLTVWSKMSDAGSSKYVIRLCGLLAQLAAVQAVHAQAQFPPLTIPNYGPAPTFRIPEDSGLHDPDEIDQSYASPQAGDFSITMRTVLLTPFVNRESVESDNVATRVMDADVRGIQTTATSVQLQSIPCSSRARLHIDTKGTVSSNTIGYTRQAQVATIGNHTFHVVKPVFFDGDRFLTKRAYGSLQVRQLPQAVNTVASGMPLFGRIGERIAWNEVYRRMPTTDSIVARQVADDVLPRVNSSVDTQLAELNQNWKKLTHRLQGMLGGDQLDWTASSTMQSFSMTAINRSLTHRTADPARQLLAELSGPEAAAIVLSEDGLNHLLARQSLAGLTLPDASLQRLVMAFRDLKDDPAVLLPSLKEAMNPTAEPLLFSVKLSDERPIQISLEDGLFTLALKFQTISKLGDPSQMHLMKVRLGGQSTSLGAWAVSVKDISVEPASNNELPDTWTKLIGTQAKQIVEKIPATELSREIDLRRFHQKLPLLKLYRIQTENAQLRVSFRLSSSGEPIAIGKPGMFGPGR
jgi:hypothetical protein